MMLALEDRIEIGRKLKRAVKDAGWQGKLYIYWDTFYSTNTEHGIGQRNRGGIAVGISPAWNIREALAEGIANFIHAFEHDPVYTNFGVYSSENIEEISTYIRGQSLAERLGVWEKFKEIGEHYSAYDLAFSEHDGWVSKRQFKRALFFVKAYGFGATIERIKRAA